MPAASKKILTLLAFFAAIALSACAYKIEIQQGNNALPANLDNLSAGMSQTEVRELLGPPQGERLFRKNIWLYSYQLRESGFLDSPKWLTVELSFNDDGTLTDIKQLRNDYGDDDK